LQKFELSSDSFCGFNEISVEKYTKKIDNSLKNPENYAIINKKRQGSEDL
jgi:hypothetical protein